MSGTTEFPVPDTGLDSLAPFWQAAARSELRLPRCTRCGEFNWYPEPQCRSCTATAFDWPLLSGRGTLFSWSVVKRALHPGLKSLEPYIPALISLDEAPDLRLVSRIVDCDPGDLAIDQPVEAVFTDLGSPSVDTGIIAPLFRPYSV